MQISNVAEQSGIGRFVPLESAIPRSMPSPERSWGTFLDNLTARVDRADLQANIARHRKWLTMMRFFMGEQLGFIDEAGTWQTINRNTGDPIYVCNLLQYFVNALLKDYVRSQAVLDVTARGGRMNMRLAARPAAELLKIIQSDQMNPTAIERDGKFAILLGNTFRYTICAQNAGKMRKEPVMEKVRLVLSGASAVCLDCGSITELADMPVMRSGEQTEEQSCSVCGSTALDIVQGAETDYTQIVGFENRMTPDVQTSIVDPFEIKLPLQAESLVLAGWLRRERFIEITKLRAAWAWAQMSETSDHATGETPLLAKSQIQNSPGNVGGQVTAYMTSPAQQDMRRFKQYWFRPEEYAEYIFQADDQFANGEPAPAGKRAIEIFPNGLYVARCGGTVLEVADEDKAKCWAMNRWEVVPNAIWAHGIDQVVEGQQMQNEVFSLVYEHIMHNTTPPVVIDSRYLSRADWSNRPGMVAVLKKGAPTGGPGAAFAVAQGRPVGSDTFGFLDMLKGNMQLLAGGAFSTASGLPDVHTDTLGGMQIQRDQALAQHISKLNRKAEADVLTAIQQLRVVKKYGLAEQYFPRLSDFSELELKMFAECDIDADLEVKARQQSWIPRSVLEQRGDLEAAMMFGGLPLGIFNPQIPRAIQRIGLELLNLPSTAEQMGADERNTLLNIVHLMEFAQMTETDENGEPMQNAVPPNPQEVLLMAAEIAPVRYRVDEHPVCIQTIIDFLKTDAGRHLSQVAELLLNDLITRHKQAIVMKAMEDATDAMMLQPGMATNAPPTQNPAMALPMPAPNGRPQQFAGSQPGMAQQSLPQMPPSPLAP